MPPENGSVSIRRLDNGDVEIWSRLVNGAGDNYQNAYIILPYQALEAFVVVGESQVWRETAMTTPSLNKWEKVN